MRTITYRFVDSPIGRLLLSASEAGVSGLDFNGDAADTLPALEASITKQTGAGFVLKEGGGLAEEAAGQLTDYFAGTRTDFDLPLDLWGTPFQRQVWGALTRIPYGEVRSYKQVAEAIGSPKAVRAVGGANNRNPVAIIVPCHRVIGAGGDMVGYGGGLPIKHFLLKHEGFIRT